MFRNSTRGCAGVTAALAVALLAGSCSSDRKKLTQPEDVTPPATVSDLSAGNATQSSLLVSWTAPGDDGSTGTAASYDLRYAFEPITAENWNAAAQASGEPAPATAGTAQSTTVQGLNANTTYHFALRTTDEKSNTSALSNAAEGTTLASDDETPPSAVTDLAAGTITTTTVQLNWTATGDDGSTGTANRYLLRYSSEPITEGNFDAAHPVNLAAFPGLPGTEETALVPGLTPGTTYHFAVKVQDEVPNTSALSNVAVATTLSDGDTTPPAAVADLVATVGDSTSVILAWTAPGDDATEGTAQGYDIRYGTVTVTEENWGAAIQVTGEPSPAAGGTTQQASVHGLAPGTTYFFALKTADEVPNTSALSNVAEATTPAGPTSPPGLSGPEFPDSVCISSDDQFAQIAKAIAQGQLASVSVYAGMGNAFFNGLSGLDWEQSGDCWNSTGNAGGCTVEYQACKSGATYTYTYTLDGSCGGQTFDHWVSYRATWDSGTRSGSFLAYDINSTNVVIGWTWTTAEDGNSGNYTFYDGDPASTAVLFTADWSRSADGNVHDLTLTYAGSTKWVSHFEKAPCSGWMKGYEWDSDASEWWMNIHIAWNADGTGSWDAYDRDGTVTEHHEW